MTDQNANNPVRHEPHWRKWLGLVRQSAPVAPPALRHAVDGDGDCLPGCSRSLLAQIADFLIDHDLEVMPFSLSIAHDCVTGGNPQLCQAILDRVAKGQPITLKWLEHAHASQPPDALAEAAAMLVGELEGSLADLGRTMAGARNATGTYSVALEGHVADLQDAASGTDVIARLTTLTRHMLDHSRSVQRDLATSEAQIGTLQIRLDTARRLANQDHLTGLPNRRAFDHLFDRKVREARLSGEALCVAFCDIDNFKRINDAHGHPAGDRVIRHVAEMLGAIADARCHVARHGGEEFAVLLCGSSLDDGWARLDAAREQIASKRLINRSTDTPFGQITFSGGIADALAYGTKAAALRAADAALYAAKNSGRNRVVIAGREPDPRR
jgi:diguanylate cyclase